MGTVVSFILLLLAAPQEVLGSLGDICYVLGARTAIVDDELYFIGGNYSTVSYDGQEINEATDLYSLKLNGQFPIERSIPQSSLTTNSISSDIKVAYDYAKNINNGDADGAVWAIDDTMYVFGGYFETPTNTISAYNTTTGKWKDVSVAGGDFNFGRRTSSLTATAPEESLGFILGGDTPFMGPSMLRFNASDPEGLSWTNETLNNGSNGIDVPNLLAGAMVYIPASTEGMLIAFGGGNITEGISPSSGWPYESDWSKIYVYDIASHTWWMQEASGDAPSNTDMFCTAVTESPDGSAFHITTYGGWSLLEQRSYEDVHILSIPSFEWIDATKLSNKTNIEQQVNSTIGRDSLSGACQTYRGSQMIVLGGEIRAGAYSLTNGACSDVFEPVRVLDLSTYQWQTSLNTSSTYEVPSIIYEKIGGDLHGGATATTPAAGFADAMLASLIQKRIPTSSASVTASSSPSSSSSSSSGDSTQNQDKDSSHTDTGAIAGGVVGGVAGLAIIVSLIWYFFLRNKRKVNDQPDSSRNSKTAELPGAAPAELENQERVEIGEGNIYASELPER